MRLAFNVLILLAALALVIPLAIGVSIALLVGRPGWTVADEWDERRVA